MSPISAATKKIVTVPSRFCTTAVPVHQRCGELHQLPIQSALEGNIEMHFYTSGHMVYAHEPDLKALHANVSAFIEKTRNSGGK